MKLKELLDVIKGRVELWIYIDGKWLEGSWFTDSNNLEPYYDCLVTSITPGTYSDFYSDEPNLYLELGLASETGGIS